MSEAELALIIGDRGACKTVLLQQLEAQCRAQGGRTVVWDHLGHWARTDGRAVVGGTDAEEAARTAIQLAPCTLFIDELSIAWPGKFDPQSALGQIVLCGRQPSARGPYRRRGPVGLVAATQAPLDAPIRMRKFIDVLYIGRFPPAATSDLQWIDTVMQERAQRGEGGWGPTAQAAIELPEGEPGKPAKFIVARPGGAR